MNDRITKMHNLLKKWIRQKYTYNGSLKIFDEAVKKLMVQYHYESGRSISELANEFNLPYSQIAYWKNKYGFERTGFYVGERIINDVRTRCLAVKEYIENSEKPENLAQKYGVRSKYTIMNWVEKYIGTYQHYIDTMPDGVPWIANEERIVYGNEATK